MPKCPLHVTLLFSHESMLSVQLKCSQWHYSLTEFIAFELKMPLIQMQCNTTYKLLLIGSFDFFSSRNGSAQL